MLNFIKKIIKMIVVFLKEIGKNSPSIEISKADIIKDNPKLFAGKDWRKWERICIHHSLTKDQQVVDWDAIIRYHVKVKGWRQIGYHAGVEIVNGKLQVMVGRPLSMVGAHCYGFNDKAIGIVNIGNYDLEKPSMERLKMTAILVKKYMKVFNIPVENVIGHCETYKLLGQKQKKTCPGTKWDLVNFRNLVTMIRDEELI